MISEDEKKTFGATIVGKARLKKLVEGKVFSSEIQAFQFAVSLALSRGGISAKMENVKTTWSTAASGVPELFELTKNLRDPAFDSEPVLKTVERLADWGLESLEEMYDEKGLIDFNEILGNGSE
jgi:hypothetical protein